MDNLNDLVTRSDMSDGLVGDINWSLKQADRIYTPVLNSWRTSLRDDDPVMHFDITFEGDDGDVEEAEELMGFFLYCATHTLLGIYELTLSQMGDALDTYTESYMCQESEIWTKRLHEALKDVASLESRRTLVVFMTAELVFAEMFPAAVEESELQTLVERHKDFRDGYEQLLANR